MCTPPNLACSRRDFLRLGAAAAAPAPPTLWIPDELIAEAYQKAASQNVLAAVNPKVFLGYFSVCADGQGFGYGNTYPSLDGHQMTDALLWLGEVETAKLNFDYVRTFQRPDGSLPIAVLPSLAGKKIGPAGYQSEVSSNGGLYTHWVPGNPLAALAAPTYIQNADVIFRRTGDVQWLAARIRSVNLAANQLASLVTPEGAVRGAGYYVERPTRIDCDGVSQPHAVDAFRRAAALNRMLGDKRSASRYEALAMRIQRYFVEHFWMGDRFAEYRHPQRGFIHNHGFTDADWCALAFGLATSGQQAALWPKLKDEKRFYYGGMPSGIATEPEKYEAWEFTHPDRMDLAAMGRVWYLECQARARMGDPRGLLDSIRRVAGTGRESGWYWRERYNEKGGYGARKYCEYPANLIRIVQRFLLGVELGMDSVVTLAPTVPGDFWKQGFGQTLRWRGRVLTYRMSKAGISGTYVGGTSQRLNVRIQDGKVRHLDLSAASEDRPSKIEIRV
ncbi:MAG: hypothetical protein LLG20_12955 [Acidobacteriales bacterium]|nr:hypothetical protein [Terriglobales bacterium]